MRKKILISVVTLFLTGVGAVVFCLYSRLGDVFGPVYESNSKQDVQKLFRIADSCAPLCEALERFKHDQDSYPNAISNLFPSYLRSKPVPPSLTDWVDWVYQQVSKDSYSLYYKLNVDDDLVCEHGLHGTNVWTVYFEGHIETNLTQEFWQR